MSWSEMINSNINTRHSIYAIITVSLPHNMTHCFVRLGTTSDSLGKFLSDRCHVAISGLTTENIRVEASKIVVLTCDSCITHQPELILAGQ
jgi:hypothetical protein